jgi:hypothetical protein
VKKCRTEGIKNTVKCKSILYQKVRSEGLESFFIMYQSIGNKGREKPYEGNSSVLKYVENQAK